MCKSFNVLVMSKGYKDDWVLLLNILGMDQSNTPLDMIIQHVASVLLEKLIQKKVPEKKM